MNVALFYHSLVSCWNHGNAHFLRGVVTELLRRGCDVAVYEPHDGWSAANLRAEHGEGAVRAFEAAFPHLRSRRYDLTTLDLERELADRDVVIVHEWNAPELVARIGEWRARHPHARALFHDTHHRSVTEPEAMARYDLGSYDGVLAYGEAIRRLYLERQLTQRAWTWHEAADVTVFRPLGDDAGARGDLVWIGNWGDDERSRELREFLIEPVRALRLRATVYGVRWPAAALEELTRAGIAHGGWLPNWRVPEAFSGFRVTVHVPRRPYVEALPGIPTIRPFEALACGIPLVSAPWHDVEGVFTAGDATAWVPDAVDYLQVRDGDEMQRALGAVLRERDGAERMAAHGLRTIRARHTCAHRVEQLLRILRDDLGAGGGGAPNPNAAGSRSPAAPPARTART